VSRTPEEQSRLFSNWYARNRVWKQQKALDHYRKRSIWIDSIKESRPCADCGGFFLACQMDFDHLADKFRNIAAMRSYSEKRILEEIAKCDIVCANCHRLRTWHRANTGRSSTG
jgi:hypothetical protein